MDFLRKLAFHFFSFFGSLNCLNSVYVRKFSMLIAQSEHFSFQMMIELLAKFMENQIRFSWKSPSHRPHFVEFHCRAIEQKSLWRKSLQHIERVLRNRLHHKFFNSRFLIWILPNWGQINEIISKFFNVKFLLI